MDILATVHFLNIENEKWQAKYLSGFRSNINYGSENFCCGVVFEGGREVNQGETISCEIGFLTHEPHIGKLSKDMKFVLFVGDVVFANGVIDFVSE